MDKESRKAAAAIMEPLPTSPALHDTYRAISATKSRDRFRDWKKCQSPGEMITIQTNRKTGDTRIRHTTESAETEIIIKNFPGLAGSSTPARKIFQFLVSLIRQKAYSTKTRGIRSEAVTFPLSMLVEMGMYQTLQSARKAIKIAAPCLMGIQIHASYRKKAGKKKTPEEEERGALTGAVLFTGYEIKNGYCTFFLNPDKKWDALFLFFTWLPRWVWSLSPRAFELVYAIFYIARQSLEAIRDSGAFSIRLRTIQQRLFLPREEDTRNPGRTIREPIRAAVAEIEEHARGGGLRLAIHGDDTAKASDWLDSGALMVELTGEYAAFFVDLAEKRAKRAAAAAAKKERITAAAMARNLSGKAEQDGADKRETPPP